MNKTQEEVAEVFFYFFPFVILVYNMLGRLLYVNALIFESRLNCAPRASRKNRIDTCAIKHIYERYARVPESS